MSMAQEVLPTPHHRWGLDYFCLSSVPQNWHDLVSLQWFLFVFILLSSTLQQEQGPRGESREMRVVIMPSITDFVLVAFWCWCDLF